VSTTITLAKQTLKQAVGNTPVCLERLFNNVTQNPTAAKHKTIIAAVTENSKRTARLKKQVIPKTASGLGIKHTPLYFL